LVEIILFEAVIEQSIDDVDVGGRARAAWELERDLDYLTVLRRAVSSGLWAMLGVCLRRG
jgi:hypothetical protein